MYQECQHGNAHCWRLYRCYEWVWSSQGADRPLGKVGASLSWCCRNWYSSARRRRVVAAAAVVAGRKYGQRMSGRTSRHWCSRRMQLRRRQKLRRLPHCCCCCLPRRVGARGRTRPRGWLKTRRWRRRRGTRAALKQQAPSLTKVLPAAQRGRTPTDCGS